MTTVKILCLANSFKRGGRCVAGVRLDAGAGEWVRPVSQATDGTLPYRACEVDGSAVEPLDIVQLPLSRPSPLRHQPENWTIGRAKWTRVPPGDRARALRVLELLSSKQRGILGTTGDRLRVDEIRSGPRHTSLALVRVSCPEFFIDRTNGKAQLRSWFTHEGVDYDLSVTEDRRRLKRFGILAGDSSFKSARDWYFTISLTEPWRDACYKIVAAVMPGPAGHTSWRS